MKENKNIERLFQEKFKDFEVSPPDFVWENIQQKLHPKENKRRVIPFWFKATGIAASFVAIISIVLFNMDNGFKNTNTNSNINNSIVTTEKNTSNQNVEGTNTSNTSNSNENQNKSNNSFLNQGENGSKSNSLVTTNTTKSGGSETPTNSKLNKNSLPNSNTYQSNTQFVSNRKKQNQQNTFKKSNVSFNISNSESVAQNQKNYRKKSDGYFQLNSEFIDFNSSKNNSSNNEISNLNTSDKFNTTKNKTANFGVTDLNASDKFNSNINNTSISGITDLNASKLFNSTKNNTTNSGISDVTISNTTTKNNNDALVENNPENATTISTAIVAVEEIKPDTITLATTTIEENPLEKLLREKETKKVVDEKEKWSKWAVNSYVSPIFFNSFASGSPISDEFSSNEKTFNTSTSYGLGLAYNVNKRLAIKTGVSNLKLDYDTEDIAFYSTFEDQSKIANTNIERNANGKYLVLKREKDVSKNAIENQLIASSQNLGNLNQRLQYIEVPLELSYAILNKKFGVAIKGGMSTLFLTENEVSIKAPDGNMQIGKASNLNDVHFSSNVGLGLSYNFMKNFQLNLEPTLKYQINTFNKNSEDFRPYIIGVNTGISYKF